MCKPCTTATECETSEPTEPARRRHTRKPAAPVNQLEELTAIGRAMADACLVFDQAMSQCGNWFADRSIIAAGNDAVRLAVMVERAAHLCGAVADILHVDFPRRPVRSDIAVNTDGNTLRDVAEQMDRLDLARGYHDGYQDDSGREYTTAELYPHLLRDRSARDPSVCPLCGSEREFNIICVEADEGDDVESWMCNTCQGDVKKAKRVLKGRRVNPDAPKRGKAKKRAKLAPAAAPVGEFCLPYFGEIDCRTAEERAADDAAGIVLPQPHIPGMNIKPKPKPKPRTEKAPSLVNRIAGIG